MATDTYTVTKEDMKIFSPQEIQEFKRMFAAFDLDGSGAIDAKELKQVLNSLGENLSDAQVSIMIREVDLDGSRAIEFAEFLNVMKLMRAPDSKRSSGRFARVVKKSAAVFEVEGSTGQHSFSETERASFSEHINHMLGSDPHVAHLLPLNPAENDLFRAVADGTLLCKLVNCAVPDTIDPRAMNFPKAGKALNVYQTTENQNLLLGAAKAIGCVIVNIGPQDLISGIRAPHLVLGLIWQIVKIQLLGAINLKAHPELVRLLDEDAGEELGELLKMPPEQVLMRWVNFHLANAGSARRLTNFGADVRDGEIYTTVLHQIQPERCDMRAMAEKDPLRRATMVVAAAKAIDVPCFIQPEDIVSGNPRMNLAFCAQLFNTCPGLTITEEEAYEMAGFLDDDEGDSREERVFRTWVNSLAIPDLYVHNLFEDMKTGVVLLQLMDAIQPGIVSWRRVNRVCKNKFKKVENANYVVVLAKQLQLSMVNIGGVDIVDGNKKLILGIVWQLMRLYILKVLASLNDGSKAVLEDDIIRWANTRVSNRGGETRMDSFRDKSLKDGRFFLDLLSSIEPRAINWELVTPGETADERANNAKYCLSVARKIGAVVFLTWEDITEVKPKMLLTFVASLWAATKTMKEQTHAPGAGAGAGSA